MPSLGTLTTHLKLDDGKFSQGVKGAQGKLKNLASRSRKAANSIGKMTPVIGAAGAAITTHLIKSAGKAGQELRTMARNANASTEEFQKNAAAAKTVGVENDKLADIYKDVNDRVGDFISSGAGPMADFFENIAPKVGVTADEFAKLSGPDALQLFVDSLEKANVSQSQMTFYMEQMASDSNKLLPLLRNQGEEMKRLGERAEEAGNVISSMEVERLAKMNESFERAQRSITKTTQKLGAELSPVVIALSNQFVDASSEARELAGEGSTIADTIASGVGFAMDAVEGIKRTFQVAGRSGAVAFLALKEDVIELAATIVESPTKAANELIGVLNQLPGMDIEPYGLSGLSKSLNTELELAREAVRIGRQDIQDILMEPMPSTGFEKALKDAQDEIGAAMSKDEFSDDQDRYQEQTEAMAERERERGERMLQVRQTIDGEFKALEQATQKRLSNLAKDGEEERNSLTKSFSKANMAARENEMSAGINALSTGLSTMFGQTKAATVAISALKRFEAISSSYAYGSSIGGPPLGAAFAATAAAAQLSTLNSAKSQSIGSSGGGGNPASGAGGGASAGMGAAGQAGQQERDVRATISLTGGDDRDRETGGSVIETINELLDEGNNLTSVRMGN